MGGGAENNRLFTAPAMGIGVLIHALGQQHPHIVQFFIDRLVGLKNKLIFEKFNVIHKVTLVINR